MTTTSQDLRVLLLSALCTCPKGAANGMTCGAWERIDEAMAVVQPELDRRDAANEQLRKERDDARATVRSILDDDLYESLHEAVEFQAARGERYRTAWWSARIRAARNDQHGEYGDADKAARQALGIAPGVDLPGRES